MAAAEAYLGEVPDSGPLCLLFCRLMRLFIFWTPLYIYTVFQEKMSWFSSKFDSILDSREITAYFIEIH